MEAEGAEEAATNSALLALQQQNTIGFTPEEAARREQRMAELQFKSDQAFLTRKRRRRVRGWGHLPPDEPGMPPRYNSETTLDECKAFLHLSNDMYQTIRNDYELICREMGVERKKAHLEDGLWQTSNLDLPHLRHALAVNLQDVDRP